MNNRSLSKHKPSKPLVTAKFKRTIKEATTTATNIDEEVLTTRRCRKMKSMNATSEIITPRDPTDSRIPKQPAHRRTDGSRNHPVKTLAQTVTPRDSSIKAIKKAYYQIKREANALTMPPMIQRKERLIVTRVGEGRREKMILKDKLPNFGLRVDRRPPSSLPSTNTNKIVKSETPNDKKAIFIARNFPSKLLLNNKKVTIEPLRITKQDASSMGVSSQNTTNTNNLLSSAASENSQNSRSLQNLTIRTRTPNAQGLETPQSGKRIKTELGPEERERRRLQYVVPVASNKYKVLCLANC